MAGLAPKAFNLIRRTAEHKSKLISLIVCSLGLLIGNRFVYSEEGSNQLIPAIRQSPPFVEFASPCYFFSDTTNERLENIRVEFDIPVTGVQASDLTVNGIPATHVEDKGAGKFIFSGYPIPELGEVTVAINSSQIRSDQSANVFEGFSWKCHLFDGSEDEDKDGLTNAEEIEHYTNPRIDDTDGDGMTDLFEVTHSCLNPIGDQAHPRSYTGELLPGDDDADDDGLTDLEEFKQGADPCSA